MMIIMASLIVAISPKPIMVTDQFLAALAMVEYGGKGQAPAGDGGRAVGPYQIHEIYRMEANRILRGPVFGSDDRKGYRPSREMSRVVLSFWAKYHRDRGVRITPAVLCSLHRHPGEAWSTRWLKTPLERGRTKRLKVFMNK